MGRFRRYRTAWSRHHRSGGFGVHSPFAFHFVQCVLSERWPYYAYSRIAQWRATAKAKSGKHWRHHALISLSDAKLLFRIANYFNPDHILVVGSRYGVSAASVKAVSTRSTLFLFSPHFSNSAPQQALLQPLTDRLRHFTDIKECLNAYSSSQTNESTPFVLINEISDEMEYNAVKTAIIPIVNGQGVVVMRNLHTCKLAARLWSDCLANAHYGQTYTNEKIGIFIANPKLQLEHFSVWL